MAVASVRNKRGAPDSQERRRFLILMVSQQAYHLDRDVWYFGCGFYSEGEVGHCHVETVVEVVRATICSPVTLEMAEIPLGVVPVALEPRA